MVIKSRRKHACSLPIPCCDLWTKWVARKKEAGENKTQRFLQWSKKAGTPSKFRPAEVDLSELLAGCNGGGDGDERS
jgi:hypothetical protein